MTEKHTGVRRFQAKVANHGFRGQFWQKGDIVEVTPEEAEVIPHHFEELGQATDGSDDKEMQEKLIEQEKIDHLKDKKAKATYDQFRPVVEGGPAVAVEKKAEDRLQEARDRKEEEKENDARREEIRRKPRKGLAETTKRADEARELKPTHESPHKHSTR